MIRRIALGAALSLITVSCHSGNGTLSTGGDSVATVPRRFDHVVIIVLENADADRVLRVRYFRELARQGAYLTNYHALTHPSYPNYLALVAGSTFQGDRRARPDPAAYRAFDRGDAQLVIDAPTVADRLDAAGLTWDAFAEDYPDTSRVPRRCVLARAAGAGKGGAAPGRFIYTRKHVPLLSFARIQRDPAACARIRDLRWLRPDSLAAYTFVTPNMIHDAHDAPLDSAAAWLGRFLPRLTSDPRVMARMLVVVTFDEADNPWWARFSARSNRVYTVLLGGMVRSGTTDGTWYTHLSLLRTIEANFGLAPSLVPGEAPIQGVWR